MGTVGGSSTRSKGPGRRSCSPTGSPACARTDREAGEVTVERCQGGALLDGDRSQESVGRQVAKGLALVAEPLEDLEVPGPWRDSDVVGLGPNGVQEGESVAERSWDREYQPVGGDANERSPDAVGDGEALIGSQGACRTMDARSRSGDGPNDGRQGPR